MMKKAVWAALLGCLVPVVGAGSEVINRTRFNVHVKVTCQSLIRADGRHIGGEVYPFDVPRHAISPKAWACDNYWLSGDQPDRPERIEVWFNHEKHIWNGDVVRDRLHDVNSIVIFSGPETSSGISGIYIGGL